MDISQVCIVRATMIQERKAKVLIKKEAKQLLHTRGANDRIGFSIYCFNNYNSMLKEGPNICQKHKSNDLSRRQIATIG